MPTTNRVIVSRLDESLQKAESLARFDAPIEKSDLAFLAGNGLQDAAHRAANCLGWIWRQWLKGTSKRTISKKVQPFVARGLELRALCQSYDYLPLHDLFLLHCAIFVCSDDYIRAVATEIADASGDKGQKPLDSRGELYLAAWCGMLKYAILGDERQASDQAALIWGAYREQGIRASPKALVTPWLKRDWPAFKKAQEKDFYGMWQRARKDHWTVKSENSTEIVVTTERYQIEHQWCWAHCGLAVMAQRQGAEVATDPFWFPDAAIDRHDKVPPVPGPSTINQPDLF